MTAGLILAAGAGRRFAPGPKQLAELGGRPLVQWAIDAQCGVARAHLDPVVLVLGAHAGAIRAAIDPRRARVVVCGEWRRGQAASLRAGLAALRPDAPAAVLVTLGDTPLLTAEIVARFALEPPGVRALYAGRPGHPVVLGPAELAALADNTGDRGARGVLAGARTIEVADLDAGRDVDTPADLRALTRRLASGGP